MILRPYQEEARAAVWQHFAEKATNPALVLPTGAGKSPLMAALVRDAIAWDARILIVAHRKELLTQTADKIRILAPDAVVGLYSAGLGVKETLGNVIVAGVQSAYRNAADLGRFDLMLIDECHLVQPDGDGMYRTLISGLLEINPDMRIAGLTATPYRMDCGMICGPDNILHEIAYEVKVKPLIRDGYLSHMVSKTTAKEIDFSQVKVVRGEFLADAVEAKINSGDVVKSSVREIIERCSDRRSCLIFGQGRDHAKNIAAELKAQGQEPEYIDGESLPFEREDILERFKQKRVKFLVNIDVLTVGFDAPNIDCVAILRPTLSPGLFYQMVGRGFRKCEGKTDCLVLDFGGNLLRHGPVDMISPHGKNPFSKAPVKTCPKCKSVCATGFGACPDCGYVWPVEEPVKREVKQDGTASGKGVVSGEKKVVKYDVGEIFFAVNIKKDGAPGTPRTMRVEYYKDAYSDKPLARQYVCIEHAPDSFPRRNAEGWWRKWTDGKIPCPHDADEAVDIARGGKLKVCTGITLEEEAGKFFPEFLAYEFAPDADAPVEQLYCTWDESADAPTPFVTFNKMQEWIWHNDEPVDVLQINDGRAWHIAKTLGFEGLPF